MEQKDNSEFMKYYVQPFYLYSGAGHTEAFEKPQPAPADSLDILAGRTEALKYRVDSLSEEIKQRKELSEKFQTEIDYSICSVDSKIDNLKKNWPWGYSPSVDKAKITMYSDLHSLEKQKRDEQIKCWSDVSRSQHDLLEAMDEFRQAERRGGIDGS
ncbi:hypothetical protein GF336_05455 [Candidatus Woesearchaeota archaeon]|nr:hypothetical protein [Candidatus Woesearchaeota archaeon]